MNVDSLNQKKDKTDPEIALRTTLDTIVFAQLFAAIGTIDIGNNDGR